MSRKTALYVLGGAGLGVAGLLAWTATRGAGPVKMTQFTELRLGPLQEHLITAEQLGSAPAASRMHYPARICPGITGLISNGFAPLWQVSDPQIMALPGEAPW